MPIPAVRLRTRRIVYIASWACLLLLNTLIVVEVQAQNGFLTFPLSDNAASIYHGWLYDPYSYHGGIDIRQPQGTNVIAAADGLAISSCQPPLAVTSSTTLQFGLFVLIDHKNGYSTLYAHLDSVL